MPNNKYRELGKNSAWTFLGNVGGKAIALLMLPFYTSILSVADYGVLDMVTGYAVTLCEVITLCITQAIFVFPKGVSVMEQKQFFSSGLFYSLIVALFLGFVFQMLIDILIAPENVFRRQFHYIYIIAGVMFLQNYMQNFIRCIGKMSVYGFIGIIYATATAIFSFLLMPSKGLEGYIQAVVLANLSSATYMFLAAHLYKYINVQSISWNKYREMFIYAAPLVVNILITFITGFLNRPFMEHYQSLDNVGMYSVASKFPTIISSMIPVFCLALQISVMEEFGKDGYKKFYNNVFRLTTVVLMFGSILLIPLGKYLIWLFASKEYEDAWIYMPMLLLSSIFSYWGYFAGTNFTAVRKSKYFLFSGMLTVMVSAVTNFVFIPNWGLWGVCIASLFTGIAFCMTRILLSRQYVILTHTRKYIAQIILFIFVSLVCVYFDIDAVSIVTGMIAAFFIIYMNRDLLPLLISQIKKK